eukprot:358375-Chlamydomonas_euryale.AAC.16
MFSIAALKTFDSGRVQHQPRQIRTSGHALLVLLAGPQRHRSPVRQLGHHLNVGDKDVRDCCPQR